MIDSPGHVRPIEPASIKTLRFLTLRQAAQELATTETTIRALIRRGELPAIQVGGRGQWRIERVKLEEYITAAYARAADDIKRGDLAADADAPGDGEPGDN
ncbi:helix-turn-helix domain-containing protein [Arthrobacter sp. MDT2-16]